MLEDVAPGLAAAMRAEMRMARGIAGRGGYGRDDVTNAVTESWGWYDATGKALPEWSFLSRNTVDLTTAPGAHWETRWLGVTEKIVHFDGRTPRAAKQPPPGWRVRFVPGRLP